MAEGHSDIVAFPTGGVAIECSDMQETLTLAKTLASKLRRGDIVLLDGGLAAGKTTFVSLVCQALGCLDQPSSPTYVISNVYDCESFEVFHVDAYRLSGIDDFLQLGIDEFFPYVITFIEWGDRVAHAFDCYLTVKIDFANSGKDSRTYRITGCGSRWISLIAKLASLYPDGRGDQ